MAEWCGKPLAETRCALAPGHDGLCCTSTEVSLVAKCESLRSSLRAAEERAEAAEFAAEGWENTARLNERKGAEWMQRAEAAERRAEGLADALVPLAAWYLTIATDLPDDAHAAPIVTVGDIRRARALARPRSEGAGPPRCSVCGAAVFSDPDGTRHCGCSRPRSEETPTGPGRGDPWCTAGFNAACSCERCAPAATDKETPDE